MTKVFLFSIFLTLALVLAAPQDALAKTTTTSGNIHVAKYGDGTFVTTVTTNSNVTTMQTVYTFDCGLTVTINRTTTKYPGSTRTDDTTYTYNGDGFTNKITTMDLNETQIGKDDYSFTGTWTGGSGATEQVSGTYDRTSATSKTVDWKFENSKGQFKTRDDVEQTKGDEIINTVTTTDFDGQVTTHTNKRHIKFTNDGSDFSIAGGGDDFLE